MTQKDLDELRNELEEKILKCSVKMGNDIRDALVEVQRLSELVDGFNGTLKDHEMQRIAFNKAIENKLDEIKEWASIHGKEEMDKYNEIIALLKATAEETDNNTRYISEKEHQEEIERKVQQQLEVLNAPKKKMWDKIKMTALGVIVTAITGGMLSALWFGFKLYVTMYGGE